MTKIKELIDKEQSIHEERENHVKKRRKLYEQGKSNSKEHKFHDSEIVRLHSVEKNAEEEITKESGYYGNSNNNKKDGDCYGNKYSLEKKEKTLNFQLNYELSEGNLSSCLMYLKHAIRKSCFGGYGHVFFRDIFSKHLENALDNPQVLRYIEARVEHDREHTIKDRQVLEKIAYLDKKIKEIEKKEKNKFDTSTKLAKEKRLLERIRLDLKLYFNVEDEEIEQSQSSPSRETIKSTKEDKKCQAKQV